MNKQRTIAIYLPQFHPFPENDEWWGKGFTEWRNVVKARPRFRGHYQPHLPADLGFYDLRLSQVREQQAEMARKYGIYGFCYYHYWFNGHLLMETPLTEVLQSHTPDFPFMICWANENWTRAWDGGEKQILIRQNYCLEDDLNHIRYLIPFLKDPRYIRVNNKPVICIYRTTLLPDVDATIRIWREEALREGLELYICRFESFSESGADYLTKEIDSAIDFQPHTKDSYLRRQNIYKRCANKIFRCFGQNDFYPITIDYSSYVDYQLSSINKNYKIYPCVTPMWDNSARRKNNFFAFTNSSPELYQKWLQCIIDNFVPYSDEENFVFINAWNEWAEGNHLEPDLKWGTSYLEATRKAVES